MIWFSVFVALASFLLAVPGNVIGTWIKRRARAYGMNTDRRDIFYVCCWTNRSQCCHLRGLWFERFGAAPGGRSRICSPQSGTLWVDRWIKKTKHVHNGFHVTRIRVPMHHCTQMHASADFTEALRAHEKVQQILFFVNRDFLVLSVCARGMICSIIIIDRQSTTTRLQ